MMDLPKKRKIAFPLSLASLTLFVGFLPPVCSTNIGKDATLSLVSKLTGAEIRADKLSLSWFGPQKTEGFRYTKKAKGIEAFVKEIILGAPLLRPIFSPKNIGSLEITEPKVTFSGDFFDSPPKSPKILESSFFPEMGTIEVSIADLIPLQGLITINKGSFLVKMPEGEEVLFSPVEIKANLTEDLPSEVSIDIGSGRGEIKGGLTIEASFGKDLSVQISSFHFPLDGVDRIVGNFSPRYAGLLVDTLGPDLEMQGSVLSREDFSEGKVALQTKNLKASLSFLAKETGADLSSPAIFGLTLTPEGSKKLASIFNSVPSLAEPLTVSITVDSLHVPIVEKIPRWIKSSFSASFSGSPYSVKTHLGLKTEGSITSQDLSQSVSGGLQVAVLNKESSSAANLTFDCKSPLTAERRMQATVSTQKIPTAILDELLPSPISPFIGNIVEGVCSVEGTLYSWDANVTITSSLATLSNMQIRSEKGTISLLAPATVTYKIEQGLFPEGSLLLGEPVTGSFTVSKASFKDSLLLEATGAVPSLFFEKLFGFRNYTFPASRIDLRADTLSNIHFFARNAIFGMNADFGIEGNQVILQAPLTLYYTIKKKDFLFALLPVSLTEDATAKITIEQGKIPLGKDAAGSEKIQAKVAVTPIRLKNKETEKELVFENLGSEIQFTGSKDRCDFSFKLDLTAPSVTRGSFEGSGVLEKILECGDFSNLSIDLTSNDLPIELLQNLYPLKTSLIGERLTSSVRFKKTPEDQTLSIDATTSILRIKGAVSLKEEGIFFPKRSGPFILEYTLTPSGYDLLTPNTPFALRENTELRCTVSELEIPYVPNTKLPDLTDTKISAVVTNAKTTFLRQNGSHPVILSDAKILLRKKASEKELHLEAEAKASAPGVSEGTLTLDAGLSKFLTEDGSFSLAKLQTKVKGQACSMASSALDAALSLDKEFFTLVLGPSFDASIDLSIENGNGPLSFAVKSPRTQLDLAGKIESGNLLLTKDLGLHFILNHETSRVFLREANASSIKSLYAPAPITITIPKRGFSFPLHPANISNITIPSGTINFGKIYCRNEGTMIAVLKQLNSKMPEGNEIEIWFAPMEFDVNQSTLTIGRTEVLFAHTYDIALWGTVDLQAKYADMSLGLTADALGAAFGIKNLPSDYVIRIPVKGPLNDVEIKGGSATSKITALVIWQSKTLSNAMGPFGVLTKVIPPPDSSKAPPPKHPFPWETNRN